jgi:hypothetical protein
MHGATRRFVSDLSGIAFTTRGPETANPSLGRRAARRSTYFTFDAVRHFPCLLFQTRYGAICFASSTSHYKENRCVTNGGFGRPLGGGYYTQWQTFATAHSNSPPSPIASTSNQSFLQLAVPTLVAELPVPREYTPIDGFPAQTLQENEQTAGTQLSERSFAGRFQRRPMEARRRF